MQSRSLGRLFSLETQIEATSDCLDFSAAKARFLFLTHTPAQPFWLLVVGCTEPTQYNTVLCGEPNFKQSWQESDSYGNMEVCRCVSTYSLPVVSSVLNGASSYPGLCSSETYSALLRCYALHTSIRQCHLGTYICASCQETTKMPQTAPNIFSGVEHFPCSVTRIAIFQIGNQIRFIGSEAWLSPMVSSLQLSSSSLLLVSPIGQPYGSEPRPLESQ